MNHRETELRPAFGWTCEDCGSDNYEACLMVDLTPKQTADIMRQVTGIDYDDDNFSGSFPVIPPRVTCRFCKSKFVTRDSE